MKQKVSKRLTFSWLPLLCISCFVFGSIFTSWSRTPLSNSGSQLSSHHRRDEELSDDYFDEKKNAPNRDVMNEIIRTHEAIKSLNKSVSTLQTQLSSTKISQEIVNVSETISSTKKKVFIVIGINTAFSSRKRRDSLRETWMPQGEKLEKLEKEKGIVIKFMIGHSATTDSILDKAIDSEDDLHKDFLRLEHVEGYHNLSAKTKIFFSTAVSKWDADFFVKIDDDIHLNLGMLASTLFSHRSKPRVYIGCMKSGSVLTKKTVKYHEPEYWKFGDEGNNYFRHATGQIYAISKDLATYIANNQAILHRYANEDVSLGAWLIGLDVEHIHDRSFCCGIDEECERKALVGEACVASYDWRCSGVCHSVLRMSTVHLYCAEDQNHVWDWNNTYTSYSYSNSNSIQYTHNITTLLDRIIHK